MSEEERIARLTELARRVWPDVMHLRVVDNRQWRAAYVCRGEDTDPQLCIEDHPRALDALEAALLVLAGEESPREVCDGEHVGACPAWHDGEYAQGRKDARQSNSELVICSAIRLVDGRIFRGHRHHDCLRTAKDVLEHEEPSSWMSARSDGIEQGFITSRNRYVDREEGLRLQLAAGIASVSKRGYGSGLFSEDLY